MPSTLDKKLLLSTCSTSSKGFCMIGSIVELMDSTYAVLDGAMAIYKADQSRHGAASTGRAS